MNKEMRVHLENAGVNVDDLMERMMGNVGLIAKFFKRFPDDKSYIQLIDGLDKGDEEEAFRAAHTLKGLCANLSMTDLYSEVSRLVESLRSGDMESGCAIMPEVTIRYEKMVEAIRNIEWE